MIVNVSKDHCNKMVIPISSFVFLIIFSMKLITPKPISK